MVSLFKTVELALENDIGKVSIEFCRKAGEDIISLAVQIEDRTGGGNSHNFLYGNIDLSDMYDFIGSLTREFR